ncbi:cupin domain-containing protein [bacterium]|nr:cupin domain-containing protein [bacterium]MBU1985422.1 cupin domain-containing protein [bacterium]
MSREGGKIRHENQGPESLLGSAHSLIHLVEYATGSIVSRVILKQSGGNVTLFAFDQGQELSEHTTPFDAVVQVLDGEVELLVGGNPVVVRAGEIAIMPAHVPHAVKALTAFKMLLTMLRS